METIPDRIYFKDLESRFVRNNAAHARSLGANSPAECVGKSDFDFFSEDHAHVALEDEQQIILSGEAIIGKIERTTMRDGTRAWVSTTKLPWRDDNGRIIGTFGLSRDVTAVREADEKLREERNLLRTIIDHLPSRIFVKDVASRYVLNNSAHLSMLGLTKQEQATGHTTLDYFPGERGQQAISDDHRVLAGESIINQEKSSNDAEGATRWVLTTKVPLRDSYGDLIGLVGISHDITRRKLAEEKLQQRTEEMEAEVEMARQIQEAFLPREYPVFPRGVPAEASALRFAHHYIPATTLGGDFFDILQLSDNKCGILVCDVMGHGVRAGLLTALIRGVVEEMGPRAEDPAHVLAEVNHSLAPILAQTGQPMFATTFFGVIDTESSKLTYANAGHPPPLLLQSTSGTIARLAPENPEPAAGLLDGFHYTAVTQEILPGDVFLAYTDGIIEAMAPDDDMFGEKRLQTFLLERRDLSGRDLLAQLVSDVEKFTGHKSFDDDVCLVAIEPTGTTCTVQPLTYDI